MRLRTMVLAACVTAGAVCAPLSARVDSKDNAALRYWSAWSLLNDKDIEQLDTLWKAKREGELDALGTEEATAWFERTRFLTDELDSASLFREIDFGIDYSEGFNTRVPHLEHMRRSWRLLDLHAARDLDEGHAADAIAKYASGLRIAAHTRDSDTLIASLVARSIFNEVVDRIDAMYPTGALEPTAQVTLMRAFVRFNTSDPFGVRDAVRGERMICGDWLERELLSRDHAGRIGFAKDIVNMGDMDHETPLVKRLFESMSDVEGVMEQLRGYRLMLDQAYEAWPHADAQERLSTLEDGLEEGAFGDLAMLVVPAIRKMHELDFAGRERFEHLRELLGG